MHPRIRVVVAVTVAAAATSTAAWAHPGFRPPEVPAGQRTEVVLAIAHDCELPGGGSSPTTVVEVQVPDSIAEAQPLERDGWTLNLVGEADGSILRAEWTRDAGTTESEPPEFRLLITPATQESTTSIPWKVYQGCEEGQYRWGAGSEDEPSVDLTVTPGTSTPPPASPTSTVSPTSTASTSTTPTTPGSATPTDRETLDNQELGTETTTSGPPWLLIAAAAITLVGGALWLVRARFDLR